MVIIGGSGTGKSVLLKCLLGLISADSGSLKMDGQEIRKESMAQNEERLRDIGVLFQGSALFDSLTVWENVAFRLIYAQHMGRKEAKKIALQKLAAVGLSEGVANLSPAEISGGMQRRVALARAIATQPHVLFFDEPTAGLDPLRRNAVFTMIAKYQRQFHFTALVVTHDVPEALIASDRVALLDKGRMCFQGTPAEFASSVNPVVCGFRDSEEALGSTLGSIRRGETFQSDDS